MHNTKVTSSKAKLTDDLTWIFENDNSYLSPLNVCTPIPLAYKNFVKCHCGMLNPHQQRTHFPGIFVSF